MTPASARCPQCGRTVPTRKTRFGDTVLSYHKMATIQDAQSIREYDSYAANPEAEPVWKITCPMSGQPVD